MAAEPVAEETAEGGEWLRRAEAAARLGVSERTLDNRLAAGKLRKRLRNGLTEVLVPRVATDVQMERALQVADQLTEKVSAQLTPLAEQFAALAEKYAEARERIGRLEAEKAQLQQEMYALRTSVQSSTEPEPRPWWRRWF